MNYSAECAEAEFMNGMLYSIQILCDWIDKCSNPSATQQNVQGQDLDVLHICCVRYLSCVELLD